MEGLEGALSRHSFPTRIVALAWYTCPMQQQDGPVFGAPHDRSFFQVINFYIAIGVVIFGLWTGEMFLAALGFAVGAIYWFTTPRHYYVMPDSLVVMYGQPRTLVVPFEAIFDANIVRVPLTSGIFVRRVNKAGVIIRPRDLEGFMGQLWSALNAAGAPAAENMLAQQAMYPDQPPVSDDAPPDEDAPPDAGAQPPDDDLRTNDDQSEPDGTPSGR